MAYDFTHIHLRSVTSTNAEMRSQVKNLDDYTVISATEQTAGRPER